MGEIAEGMLDGTFCESCGEYIGASDGPAYCNDCEYINDETAEKD